VTAGPLTGGQTGTQPAQDDAPIVDPAPAEAPAPAPAPVLRRRDPMAGVPLSVRLVALLVALVAAALAVTGFAATSLLRGYLLDQRDDQLQLLAQDVQTNPAGVLQQCAVAGGRFPSSTYVACVVPDTSQIVVTQGPRASDGGLPDVSQVEASSQDHGATAPFSVAAQDGSSTWRVVVAGSYNGLAIVIGTDQAADRELLGKLVRVELVVGLAIIVVLGTAGYLLVRNSLRPLRDVEHTAQAIAAGDLSRRVPTGDERTEVGRLSNALNGMLARIEGAFRAQQTSEEHAVASEARMRRFVADASHELRTPLTSIRGFAELHRQGAVRDPAEVQRLMQRIESEATRMGLLVEDLLQLARLDQQRPLDVVPVDLAELAGDAVHDARAVSPDRPLDLVLDPSLTEVPVVLGDEARLRQVIGNLVTNAVTHTPAGTPVTVRISEPAGDPDTLCVAVTDQGQGMAPADAERVFERFYRADTSRTRAAGGSGLGLSIVAALVAAHGGRVELTTAPGQGATFTVRLPRSGPDAPDVPDPDGPGPDAPGPDAPGPDAPGPDARWEPVEG
jgi:signal transduction histidine kinase